MLKDAFNSNESYEWHGQFWFPDEKDSYGQLFGKAYYTPEQGINFELRSDNKELLNKKGLTKKIMYGKLIGKTNIVLTFFEVILFRGFGFSHGTEFIVCRGQAKALASGVIKDTSILSISLEYDNHFKNFFFSDEEAEALKISDRKSIITNDNYEIKFEVDSHGQAINPDELDVIFWSPDKKRLKELKKAMQPHLQNGSIYHRKAIRSIVKIQATSGTVSLKELMTKEKVWRNYFEMLIDNPISTKQAWIEYKDNNNSTCKSNFLSHVFVNKNTHNDPPPKVHLKINLSKFKRSRMSILTLQKSFKNWSDINNNQKWKPALEGIRRLIGCRQTIIDTPDFSSLISDIETFLDLTQSNTKANCDSLITLYAPKKWQQEYCNIACNPAETLGQWTADIRNAIVHPKSALRKQKFWKIASDPVMLHTVYSYVGAILIKGILEHLGGIKKQDLDNFLYAFIQNRLVQEVQFE